MASNTFTLTSKSSQLSCSIFPEVVLDEKSEYSCALLELTTYHSIPNVTDSNNRVHFYWTRDEHKIVTGSDDGELVEFRVPVGSYEAHEILDYIKEYLNKYGFSFNYKINKNTLKTSIACSTALHVGPKYPGNIFYHIFGFLDENISDSDTEIYSDDIVKIASQDVVRVECNIVSGSFVNGKSSHTLHEFATNKVDVGYKIIERPKNLIYLPVVPKRLNYIEISLVDQNGKPIDFRGETVTCRIHIKKE